MFALGIRYLNGYVVACEPDSRERVEWPPHPGRVFMALAATHFETGADPMERDALLWLEALPSPPSIRAQGASQRGVVTQYVPVNDKAGPSKTILQSAPLARDRQRRIFARAWLEDDTVHLTWPDVEAPADTRRALERLCAGVSRVGHSSSLVQMWIAEPDEVGDPTWLPAADRATIQLRIAGPGTLDRLERRYNREAVETFAELQVALAESDGRARTEARKRLKQAFPDGPPLQLRPALSAYQGYARPVEETEQLSPPGTIFGPHPAVLTLEREDGPYRHLDLLCVLAVTQRWRRALLSKSDDLSARARELLSGHGSDEAPLEAPHLTFLPLAFVGHAHADGRLLGLGLAFPEGLSSDDRREVLRAPARVQVLRLGRLGTWRVATSTAMRPPWNLRPEVWTAHPVGATHWSTVTPIAFDRHPKTTERSAYRREVAGMIAEACTRIGLPEPREVIVTPVSAHLGVPPAHAFPKLRRKDGGARRHAHAILAFAQAVRGPILLGAGRYRGYGFCRPIADADGEPT